MGIPGKVLSLGAISLFLGILVLIGVYFLITGPHLWELEEVYAQEKSTQIRRVLESQWTDLGRAVEDWAYWEESAKFMKGQAPDYIGDNLNGESFRALWLDSIVFFNMDKNIHWLGTWNPELGAAIHPKNTTEIQNLFLELTSISPQGLDEGYVKLSTGWFLLALRPIQSPEEPGITKGYLMFTRKMDSAFWDNLSAMAGSRLSPRLPTALTGPGDYTRISSLVTTAGRFTELALGITGLRKILSLEIHTVLERRLEAAGLRAGIQTSVIFFLVLSLTTLFGMAAFHRLLVKPLGDIAAFLTTLGQTGNYSLRLPPGPKDEMGLLSRGINSLVEAVQERTARLETMASTDSLTGLLNRRAFDQALDMAWRICRREKLPLGLVMADVDHFKAYNDTYGHSAGDTCLRAVAHSLVEAAKRPGDLRVRYGGEEFAMILPHTDPAGVQAVCEAARAGLEALGLPHSRGEGGQVTLSLGWVCCVPGDQSPWDVLKQADQALYQAKKAGRNRVTGGALPLA